MESHVMKMMALAGRERKPPDYMIQRFLISRYEYVTYLKHGDPFPKITFLLFLGNGVRKEQRVFPGHILRMDKTLFIRNTKCSIQRNGFDPVFHAKVLF